MIGLFCNCLITGVQQQRFVFGHSPINDFVVRLRKNRVLNEPIRFEKVVSFLRKYETVQIHSDSTVFSFVKIHRPKSA